MGTRADFYVGKGKDAEWIGSIAMDGYRDGIAGYILKAKNETVYRKAVETFLKSRDDARFPDQGWPWPWDDSGTSDCSYWFFDGQCWDAHGAYMVNGDCGEHDVFLSCRVPELESGYQDEDGFFLPERIGELQTVEYPCMTTKRDKLSYDVMILLGTR